MNNFDFNKTHLTTIRLILHDGTLDGILRITTLKWPLSGVMLVSPREHINKLIEQYKECENWGIYLLISKEQVYIGQASELKSRIKQHLLGKDWWERVFIFTTDNDSLNRGDIDYIEGILINHANEVKKLNSDNKKSGNKTNIDYYRKAELDEYIRESLFILNFIGVDVFDSKINTNKKTTSLTNLIESKPIEQINNRNKKEIFDYIKQKVKIDLNKNSFYSKFYDNKKSYWLTLKSSSLDNDIKIILNNTIKQKIYVLLIPAKTFDLSKNKEIGKIYKTRNDDRFDLYIDDNLIEKQNKINLSTFKIHEITYNN